MLRFLLPQDHAFADGLVSLLKGARELPEKVSRAYISNVGFSTDKNSTGKNVLVATLDAALYR